MFDLVKFLVVLAFLLYSCKLDVESRIVPNKVWKYMLASTLPITILQLVTERYPEIYYLVALLMALMVISLAYLLYYIGAYGGADAKAIMCLAVIFPFYPTYNSFPILNMGFGSFAFSTLANSVLAAPVLLVAMFIRNLIVEGVKEMRGNVLYYMTGYRVSASKIPKFHNLLEYIDERGKLVRVRRAVEPDDAMLRRLEKSGMKTVWVTPALPFLLFITAGYAIAFIVGDLLYFIISKIPALLSW